MTDSLQRTRPAQYLEPVSSHRADPQYSTDSEHEEGADRYEVEAILDRRAIADQRAGKHRIEYLVKWAGYDASHNLWLPETNLDGCQAMLREYLDTRAMCRARQRWQCVPPLQVAAETTSRRTVQLPGPALATPAACLVSPYRRPGGSTDLGRLISRINGLWPLHFQDQRTLRYA